MQTTLKKDRPADEPNPLATVVAFYEGELRVKKDRPADEPNPLASVEAFYEGELRERPCGEISVGRRYQVVRKYAVGSAAALRCPDRFGLRTGGDDRPVWNHNQRRERGRTRGRKSEARRVENSGAPGGAVTIHTYRQQKAKRHSPLAGLRHLAEICEHKSLWIKDFNGGEGIRTPDLFIANEPLSQLSYTPKQPSAILTSRLISSKGSYCSTFWLVEGRPCRSEFFSVRPFATLAAGMRPTGAVRRL